MSQSCSRGTAPASSRLPHLNKSASRILVCLQPGRASLQCAKAQSSPTQFADTDQLATELNAVDKFLISMVRKVARTDFLWLPLASLARQEILSTAEDENLSVEEYAEDLKKAGVEEMLEQVEDKSLKYPEYYLSNFHGYPDGNLSWKAAFEAKIAWMSITMKEATRRPDFDAQLSIHEVAEGWGKDCAGMVQQFCDISGAPLPKTVLDVGCSTGYSSRSLQQEFPGASITGVDASPYFLAAAETEEKMRGATGGEKIQYKHAVFEDMEQPESSVDMVYFQFILHELPKSAIAANLAKAAKVVRPGGIVGFADVNPRSEALSKLPPAIKALRAASEPWLEEYEKCNIEAAFEQAGLEGIKRLDMNSRHHGYFAVVP